ncbi:hypothetical protein [Streptomyces sp. NPDC088350]|uniref:hypothetical protein n=1 Tax=Streptomyces sp. NPDC088350 TaxID=3365854 RepID=UPI0037F2806D
MARRFKDMPTPEQQWAAQQTDRSAAPVPARPYRPATDTQWRAMTPHQKAAELARSDGREDDAREWERLEAEGSAPQPKKKRGWLW